MAAYREGFRMRMLGMMLAAGVVMLFAPLAVRAQSCTVNVATDNGGSGGAGSGTTGDLRYCVAQANAYTSGTAVTYNIGFAGSLDGQTITVNSTTGTLTINPQTNVSVAINGPGANLLTVSGGNAVVIFDVGSDTAAPAVSISGLTIANGSGNLGGAIQDQGTLTIGNCTFAGNNASEGGAIFVVTTTTTQTVKNSTFIGNSASTVGGGGAIYVISGGLVVTNGTFTGNTAQNASAINLFGDTLTINNSTFFGNTATTSGGGAIYNSFGTLTVNNSIMTGDSGGECVNNASGACPSTGDGKGNVVGSVTLAPLGWYGGSTQTMIPLPGSAAIGAGSATSLNTDQRGFSRPTTGSVDAGAVQTNYLMVSTVTDANNTPADCAISVSGTCSLRDALNEASTANYRGGADIAFASGVIGLIDLGTVNSPLTEITGNLNLMGPGANLLTVSGGNSTSVGSIFYVIHSTAGLSAAFSGLTIANGSSGGGGGILNFGVLTVSNCTFSGNRVTGSGGAIVNNVSLIVRNCAFSNNSASVSSGGGGGGAIEDGGIVITISNSTFAGNTIGDNAVGGAIMFFSEIDNPVLQNDTFYGNTSANGVGGAIFGGPNLLTVINSVFSGNTAPSGEGGAIFNSGTLAVSNSILMGDSDECDGNGGCPTNGSSGNEVGGTAAQVNLAPLGWYGGTTETMIPLPGSVALCAGSTLLLSPGLTTDQRGFPRTNLTSNCLDAGAVQTNYLVVTTTADSNNTPANCPISLIGANTCSLRDAINEANTAPYTSGADITFTSSVTPTITLGASLPNISGYLDLPGPGASLLTVSGGNSAGVGSVFTVNAGAQAALSGIGVAYGSSAFGGGITNRGTLTLNNSNIHDDTAESGGGIFNPAGGTLCVFNSTLSGNDASTGNGGGLASSGTLVVGNSTLTGNQAAGVGGGMLIGAGAVAATSSTFSSNMAGTKGGGSYITAGTVTLSNSILAGNTAPSGAGIYNASGTLSLYGDIIGDNSATGSTTTPTVLLAPLGSYGGPTPTQLLLPGSVALCAGVPAQAAGLLTDQRSYPRLNTTYTGYSSSTPCVDAGAVQTNYQSIQFPTLDAAYTGSTGVAVSTPAAPIVSVIENNQNIGGVPVTLAISGSPSTSGVWTETTTAGAGATFDDLIVNTAGDYTLSSTLNITSTVSISTTGSTNGDASLDIANPATTTTITGTSPNPSVVGQSVTISFTVVPVSASGTPTGTVTVSDGGADSCQATVAVGECSITFTASGSKTLNASYPGDSNFTSSNTTTGYPQMVNAANTTTTITGHTPNPSVTGQGVTVSFKVTVNSPGVGTPTGTVTVSDGTGDTCVGAPSATPVSCTLIITTAGTKTLTATYNGDGNFNSSPSAGVRQTVNKAQTRTTLNSHSPNPSVTGQSVTFDITVTSVAPGSGTPTGNVTIVDLFGNKKCTATLAAGAGNCQFTITSPGPQILLANYGGDGNYDGSLSVNFSQNVVDFALSAGPATQSVTPGNKVTYTLTVTPESGFAGTVSLACGGAPAGSTCTLSHTSLALSGGHSQTSTVTVQTTHSTPGGTDHLTLTGTFNGGNPATGGLTHSASVTLDVR